VNVRVYAPVVLMMVFALAGAAGTNLENLFWPFLVIESILVAGSLKYRFDQVRRLERRTLPDRRRYRRDDS
jgi:hypothetical protein